MTRKTIILSIIFLILFSSFSLAFFDKRLSSSIIINKVSANVTSNTTSTGTSYGNSSCIEVTNVITWNCTPLYQNKLTNNSNVTIIGTDIYINPDVIQTVINNITINVTNNITNNYNYYQNFTYNITNNITNNFNYTYNLTYNITNNITQTIVNRTDLNESKIWTDWLWTPNGTIQQLWTGNIIYDYNTGKPFYKFNDTWNNMMLGEVMSKCIGTNCIILTNLGKGSLLVLNKSIGVTSTGANNAPQLLWGDLLTLYGNDILSNAKNNVTRGICIGDSTCTDVDDNSMSFLEIGSPYATFSTVRGRGSIDLPRSSPNDEKPIEFVKNFNANDYISFPQEIRQPKDEVYFKQGMSLDVGFKFVPAPKEWQFDASLLGAGFTAESVFIGVDDDKTLVLRDGYTVWNEMLNPTIGMREDTEDPMRLPYFLPFAPVGGSGLQVRSWGFHPDIDGDLYFISEVPHDYIEGTNFFPHIHWSPSDPALGNVVWDLECSYVNAGTVNPFPPPLQLTIVTGVTGIQYDHLVDYFGLYAGDGIRINAKFICRVSRLGTDPRDNYPSFAFAHDTDFDYEADTMGSRLQLTK